MNEKIIKVFSILLVFVFVVLWARLWELQIFKGKTNRILADSNRIQRKIIEAPRGLILDRHGEILAKNEPVYEIKDEASSKKVIARDEALILQAESPDTIVEIKQKRLYPFRDLFAHLIGYVGEISEKELKEEKLDLKGYGPGSLVGRAGVESQYEELLKGREGSELVEVNTVGKVIRHMGQILPKTGKILTLAIDKNLQEIAGREMEGKKGAVVALDPRNGEILVFYSSPSYDPNLFLKDSDQAELLKIIHDQNNNPLLNRVIAGSYPPGSTFKIVTAVAGLEEGAINANSLIKDTGIIRYGNFSFTNWYYTSYGKTEGEVDIVKALARSTDTFFYKLGEMVGIEKLNYWAQRFNIGQKTGIDLPGEIEGFMATPEWKKQNRNEDWFLGNTYHISIGQGDLSLTPLQVAALTSAVASEGKICQPRILKIGAENTPYGANCRNIDIKKQTLELVKKGMIAACSSGGTGFPFFDFKPQVACKTGTAETGDGKTTHAWFTVFAPASEPKIVLTVLVERGGEGSSVAAPIAKEILKQWFKSQ